MAQAVPNSLGEAENAAMAILATELKDHAVATQNAFNLVGHLLRLVPDQRLRDVAASRRVAVSLMNRLSDDLRCAALLALRGYPIQALTLTASMYESSYCLAYIGADDALAEEWIAHDDPTRPFRPVKSLTVEVLRRQGVDDPEEASKKAYRVYRQLCLAKHGNPVLQRQHGYEIEDGALVATNGPHTAEPAIRAARFALEHATRLTLLAASSFGADQLDPASVNQVHGQLADLEATVHRLAQEAIARYGNDDPFPGAW